MSEIKVCFRCKSYISTYDNTGDIPTVECHCDIDGRDIGPKECVEVNCKNWAKDKKGGAERSDEE